MALKKSWPPNRRFRLTLGLIITSLSTGVQADEITSVFQDLHLPMGQVIRASFNQWEAPGVHVLEEIDPSNDSHFGQRAGRDWINKISTELPVAYANYIQLHSTGMLQFCETPAQKPPELSVIFYSFEVENEGSDRSGFAHPDNPGILIQSRFWDPMSTRALAFHEAVHRWCNHRPYKSELEHWLEEGAADAVVFATIRRLPQRSISDYFGAPCKRTYYGGSFLWWLARMQTTNHPEQFAQELASLHLGARATLGSEIYGRLSEQTCTPAERKALGEIPHAEDTHELSPARSTLLIPYSIAPGREIDFSPTHPKRAFQWFGPQ